MDTIRRYLPDIRPVLVISLVSLFSFGFAGSSFGATEGLLSASISGFPDICKTANTMLSKKVFPTDLITYEPATHTFNFVDISTCQERYITPFAARMLEQKRSSGTSRLEKDKLKETMLIDSADPKEELRNLIVLCLTFVLTEATTKRDDEHRRTGISCAEAAHEQAQAFLPRAIAAH